MTPLRARTGNTGTNHLLLGFTIRKTTGKFYSEMLRDRIIKPLGMTATSRSRFRPNLDEKHSYPDRIAHLVAGLYVPAVAPDEK